MELKQKGFNSFQLKILALIFMTFDHIHYMLSGVSDVPVWFNMIGRIAAPIFIYMVVDGIRHTHSLEKYMLRLYIGFVVMSILNIVIDSNFVHPTGAILMANIFGTLFLICYLVYIAQKIKSTVKNKNFGKMILFVIIGLIPIVGGFGIMALADMNTAGSMWIFRIVFASVPTVISVEGGIGWLILGLGFYLCKENKILMSIFYVLSCIAITMLNGGISIAALFSTNIQWMMKRSY